jgi:hypothetical protein
MKKVKMIWESGSLLKKITIFSLITTFAIDFLLMKGDIFDRIVFFFVIFPFVFLTLVFGVYLYRLNRKILSFISSTTWRYIFIPLVIMSLFAVAFYWFQWRPSEVRKKCANEIVNTSGQRIKNNKYRECLLKEGMKPESLYVNLD